MSTEKVSDQVERSRSRFLRLPLNHSERRFLLVVIDLLAVNSALLIALGYRADHVVGWEFIQARPIWFAYLSFLWLAVGNALDVYDLQISGSVLAVSSSAAKTGAVTALVFLFTPYITPGLLEHRSELAVFALLVLLLPVSGRAVCALALRQGLFLRRTLVVGVGREAATIERALLESGDTIYSLVGFVHCEVGESAEGGDSGDSRQPSPILGERDDIASLVRSCQINTLVLAVSGQSDLELLCELSDSLELGVEIIPMPVLYEQLTGQVPIDHIGTNWYMGMPVRHSGTGTFSPAGKRVVDVVLASVGLLFLAAATPFIAAAIWLDCRGPVFYSQTRVGKGGTVINLYKFRSMVPHAETGGAVWAKENDQRVTRVGRFLRATHIDEFPQFLNILMGEMSVVGPRPERPEFVEELSQVIPFYGVRHAVKPGMAGWALVKQGYSGSKEDALTRLQYDLYYIKHQSLWLDFVILLKTVIDTISLRGR